MNQKTDSYTFPLSTFHIYFVGFNVRKFLTSRSQNLKLSWAVKGIFTPQSLSSWDERNNLQTIHIYQLQSRTQRGHSHAQGIDGKKAGSSLADFKSSYEVSCHYHLLHMADLAYRCSWPLGRSWWSFYMTAPLQRTDRCPCLSREPSTTLTARLQHSLQKILTTKLEIVLPADLNSSPLKTQHLTSQLAMNKQDQQPNHIVNSSCLGK